MARLPNPVIVLPGVIASYLWDNYELPPRSIWQVMEGSKDYERATLHPDNLRYEAMEPARVVAGQVYEIAYRELIEELRHNLSPKADQPVPVYPFSYDWRQPLSIPEADLASFVTEVIERTKLMRHYDRNEWSASPKVDLVGHSMGGLIIAGYLQSAQGSAKIGKVVTIATPFQGSYEAVVKITTGTSGLGGSQPSSREREAARVTPSLYHLMPVWPNAVIVNGKAEPKKGLFDRTMWQGSILATIREFIRLKGLNRKDTAQQAEEVFAGMLKVAKSHRDRINSLQLSKAGLKKEDWLCVVGADVKTRITLNVQTSGSNVDFVFRDSDSNNLWSKNSKTYAVFTGDGTVPLIGALPTFLDKESVVVVTPDNFGDWELQDRLLASTAGLHGILPNMNMLHLMIVSHLTGRPGRPDTMFGARFPSATSWNPPVKMRESTPDWPDP